MALIYEHGRYLRGQLAKYNDPIAREVIQLWSADGFVTYAAACAGVKAEVGEAAWAQLQAVRQSLGKEVFYHALYAYWASARASTMRTSCCAFCVQSIPDFCIRIRLDSDDFPALMLAVWIDASITSGRVVLRITTAESNGPVPLEYCYAF